MSETIKTPGARILVADDNRVNLKITKSLLETFDATVTTVSSGIKAVDLVKEGNTFDIIFMDHLMPEMDGVEAALKIWEYEGKKRTPIVALSANTDEESEAAFAKAGLVDWLRKPIIMRELVAILTKYLLNDGEEVTLEEEKTEVENSNINIEGKSFDPELGISRFWNDEKMYKDCLRLFLDKSAEDIKIIDSGEDASVKKDAIENFIVLAYAAGATRLAEYVKEVKAKLDSGNPDAVETESANATDEYKIVYEEIKAYLGTEESVNIMDLFN